MVPTKGQHKVACAWGFMFAAVAIGLDRVHAIINLDNFCQDGARHTCATNRQRLAVCWGSNLYGQGDLPRPTANMSRVYCKFGDYIDDLSSRVKYKCEDKGLIAYQLSDPFAQVECLLPEGRIGVQASLTRWNTTTDYREKPVFRFDGRFVCSVQKMSAGGHHTCLIYGDDTCTNCNNGYLECFGWNDYNQTNVPQCIDGGDPWYEEIYNDKPVVTCKYRRAPLTFREVSAGLFHTCAVTTWSELVCWGDNRSGQLANMVVGEPSYPTSVKFQKVCSGAYHSCAIIESFPNEGQVDCWGNNEYGQAKDWEDLLQEELVQKGGKFIHISCGASHTCGTYLPAGNTLLGKTGTSQNYGQKVICWGADFAGQISVPSNLANEGNRFIVGISVGWEHSCAASLQDNAVYCWGGKKVKPGLDKSLLPTTRPCVCLDCVDGNAPSTRPQQLLFTLLTVFMMLVTVCH